MVTVHRKNNRYDVIMKKILVTGVLLGTLFNMLPAGAEVLDRIVAIVEDDVILDRELQTEVDAIMQRIKGSNAMVPPAYILRKQVLEKMVIEKLQRQLAEMPPPTSPAEII